MGVLGTILVLLLWERDQSGKEERCCESWSEEKERKLQQVFELKNKSKVQTERKWRQEKRKENRRTYGAFSWDYIVRVFLRNADSSLSE